jgi:hypothetical protein
MKGRRRRKRRDGGPIIFSPQLKPTFCRPKDKDARHLHERGLEKKRLHLMADRTKARFQDPNYEPQSVSRRPVTLSSLKWGKTPPKGK